MAARVTGWGQRRYDTAGSGLNMSAINAIAKAGSAPTQSPTVTTLPVAQAFEVTAGQTIFIRWGFADNAAAGTLVNTNTCVARMRAFVETGTTIHDSISDSVTFVGGVGLNTLDRTTDGAGGRPGPFTVTHTGTLRIFADLEVRVTTTGTVTFYLQTDGGSFGVTGPQSGEAETVPATISKVDFAPGLFRCGAALSSWVVGGLRAGNLAYYPDALTDTLTDGAAPAISEASQTDSVVWTTPATSGIALNLTTTIPAGTTAARSEAAATTVSPGTHAAHTWPPTLALVTQAVTINNSALSTALGGTGIPWMHWTSVPSSPGTVTSTADSTPLATGLKAATFAGDFTADPRARVHMHTQKTAPSSMSQIQNSTLMSAGSVTTFSTTFAGAIKAGDFLVGIFVASGTQAVSDNINGAWTQVGAGLNGVSGWFKQNSLAASAGTLTVTVTGTSGTMAISVSQFRNVDTTSSVLDVSVYTNVAGTTVQSSSITPGASQELILFGGFTVGGAVGAASPGQTGGVLFTTEGSAINNSTGANIYMESIDTGAPGGAQTPNFTDTKSLTWNVVAMYFKPASGLLKDVPFSGNLLSTEDSSFEAGSIGDYAFAAGINISLINTGAQALNGTRSLRVTKTVNTGNWTLFSGGSNTNGLNATPAFAGVTYSAMFSALAATTGEPTQCGIQWWDINGNPLSQVIANGTDVTSGWTQTSVTNVVAPAGTAFMSIMVAVGGTQAIGEVHYIDQVGIFQGNTSVWTINQFNDDVQYIIGADLFHEWFAIANNAPTPQVISGVTANSHTTGPDVASPVDTTPAISSEDLVFSWDNSAGHLATDATGWTPALSRNDQTPVPPAGQWHTWLSSATKGTDVWDTVEGYIIYTEPVNGDVSGAFKAYPVIGFVSAYRDNLQLVCAAGLYTNSAAGATRLPRPGDTIIIALRIEKDTTGLSNFTPYHVDSGTIPVLKIFRVDQVNKAIVFALGNDLAGVGMTQSSVDSAFWYYLWNTTGIQEDEYDFLISAQVDGGDKQASYRQSVFSLSTFDPVAFATGGGVVSFEPR